MRAENFTFNGRYTLTEINGIFYIYDRYDEDFKFYATKEELIDYALEQSKEYEDREYDNNEYPYGEKYE